MPRDSFRLSSRVAAVGFGCVSDGFNCALPRRLEDTNGLEARSTFRCWTNSRDSGGFNRPCFSPQEWDHELSVANSSPHTVCSRLIFHNSLDWRLLCLKGRTVVRGCVLRIMIGAALKLRSFSYTGSDMDAWHRLDPTDVLQRVGVDSRCGLSEVEAARRQARYGPNELTERARCGPAIIL
jgi:hypothetical protein